MVPRFFLHRAVGKKTPLSTGKPPSPGCPQPFHVESTDGVEKEERRGKSKNLSQPSPWGEGTPVRTLGGMRGAILGEVSGKTRALVAANRFPDPSGHENRAAALRRARFIRPRRRCARTPPHPSASLTPSPRGEGGDEKIKRITAFPLGGRYPSAHTGGNEGAHWGE